MKHLKRIFESTEELDTDYIEMCFVDFIDQGCDIEIENDEEYAEYPNYYRRYIEFMIDLPGIEIKNSTFINKNKKEKLNI